MSDYLPRDADELRTWYLAFLGAQALPLHGPAVGVTAGDISAINSAVNGAIAAIDSAKTKEQQAASAIADRDALIKAANGVVRPIVRRLKTHSSYTDTHGQALGVIAANSPVNPENIKPTFTISVTPQHVRLRIRRPGAESVHVYCRKPGELNWTDLGRWTRAEFLDTRPLTTPGTPEVREYCVHAYIGDEMVGQPSDTKMIVFTGTMAA